MGFEAIRLIPKEVGSGGGGCFAKHDKKLPIFGV